MTRLCALALATAIACGGAGAGRRASTLPVYLEAVDTDGEPMRLRELRGRPVVLHLFTVGSMAAQMDVAQLNAIHDANRAAVVGISLDPATAKPLVRAWPEAAGAHYRVVFGSSDLITGKTDLGPVPSVPATIVLDEDGVVTFRVDRQLGKDELEHALAR